MSMKQYKIIAENRDDLETEEPGTMSVIMNSMIFPWSARASTIAQTSIYTSVVFVAGMFLGKTLHKSREASGSPLLGFGA